MRFVGKTFNLNAMILENQSAGFYQFISMIFCFIYIQAAILMILSESEIKIPSVRQLIAYSVCIVIDNDTVVNHAWAPTDWRTQLRQTVASEVAEIGVPDWHPRIKWSAFTTLNSQHLSVSPTEGHIWKLGEADFKTTVPFHFIRGFKVIKPLYYGIYLVHNTHFYIFYFNINNNVLIGGVLHIHTNLKPRIFFCIKFHRHTMCKISGCVSGFCCFINGEQKNFCITQSITRPYFDWISDCADFLLRIYKFLLTSCGNNNSQCIAVLFRIRQEADRNAHANNDCNNNNPERRLLIIHHRLHALLYTYLAKGKRTSGDHAAVYTTGNKCLHIIGSLLIAKFLDDFFIAGKLNVTTQQNISQPHERIEPMDCQ